MCNHTSHTKDILCPVCAKNKIYDLNEKIKIKDLIIYFLDIDEGFIFDFKENMREFEYMVKKSLKYRDSDLDSAFYKSCGRLRIWLNKINYNSRVDQNTARSYIKVIERLENIYSYKK